MKVLKNVDLFEDCPLREVVPDLFDESVDSCRKLQC